MSFVVLFSRNVKSDTSVKLSCINCVMLGLTNK